MLKRFFASIAFLLAATTANADLQIEITGGINEGHKIAVYPFTQNPAVKLDVASVVSASFSSTAIAVNPAKRDARRVIIKIIERYFFISKLSFLIWLTYRTIHTLLL